MDNGSTHSWSITAHASTPTLRAQTLPSVPHHPKPKLLHRCQRYTLNVEALNAEALNVEALNAKTKATTKAISSRNPVCISHPPTHTHM